MSGSVPAFEYPGCDTASGFPMSSYTSIRVGGRAGLVVFPRTPEALAGALSALSARGEPFAVLGGGTNTIVRDEGPPCAVVSTSRLKGFQISPGGSVFALAGAPLAAVMNGAARLGLGGLEFAAGIPGTVGGAVCMNAGTDGGEVCDVLESVTVWTGGREREMGARELRPRYRDGGVPPGATVLSARLRLAAGNDPARLRAAIRERLASRKATQPVCEANTGSVFKNPRLIPAGRLLEELGMKSVSEGGASFSEVHANFIVNKGGATAADVLKLIDAARRRALAERGITLETEVCVI